jgi:hypothetical protein
MAKRTIVAVGGNVVGTGDSDMVGEKDLRKRFE